MKELPQFENKRISDQEVIDALRRGADNPETKKILEAWSKEADEGKDLNDSIEFNRRKGRVYIEAGYIKEGLESLEEAFDEAWFAHMEELASEIRAEIDGLVLE